MIDPRNSSVRRTLGLASVLLLCPALYGQVLQSSKTDTFVPNPVGRATPGSAIDYQIQIQNTGSVDATGVTFTDPTPAGTTLEPASVNVSPLARQDTYSSIGNTLLRVGGIPGPGPERFIAGSVLANDTDFLGDTAAITSVQGISAVVEGQITATSALGGTVTLNKSDGTFTYLPPTGLTGVTDTFGYQLRDDGPDNVAGNADDLSDTGTVSIQLTQRVWYINQLATGPFTGRSTQPFASLASVSGATGPDADGDILFVHSGSGAGYTGGIVLLANQSLIGSNEALVVNGFVLLAAGAEPLLTHPGGATVTVVSGNTIKGLTIGNSGTWDITGTPGQSVGALTISNVILTGTGGLLNIPQGGTLAVTLDSATTTSATGPAVNLESAGGSCTLDGGNISGTNGGVRIAGGTLTYLHRGNLSISTGRPVEISNKTVSGDVTFQNRITGSGSGILLDNNDGAVIRFRSMALSTGTNAAFTATNGGTIHLADSRTDSLDNDLDGSVDEADEASTLSTTSAAALQVSATAIGSDGLVFQSISSGAGASMGISLTNTGTAGGLTVTGSDGPDGDTLIDAASGGTITGKTGPDGSISSGTGIYLANTSKVALHGLALSNCSNHAIRGLSVSGFTLGRSTISGTSGDSSSGTDGALSFGTSNPGGANGLLGSCLIDQVEISGAIEHQLECYHQSGSVALTVSNCQIHDNSTQSGSDGILVETQGTASGTYDITNSTFDDNKSQAVQISALDSSEARVSLLQNTVLRSTQGNEGFILSNAGSAKLVARIEQNNLSGMGGAAIFVGQTPGNATSSSQLHARILNNTINHPASATNSALLGLFSSTPGQIAPARLLIQGNTITQNSTTGVARAILIDTPDTNTNPDVQATVLQNTAIINGGDTSATGIVVQVRRGTGTFNVLNNTVTFPGLATPPPGLRVRQDLAATVRLELGTAPGGSSAAIALAANHPVTTTSVLGTVSTVNNSTTLLPDQPLLLALEAAEALASIDLAALSPTGAPQTHPATQLPAFAPAPSAAPEIENSSGNLTPAALDRLVSSSLDRWESAGLSPDLLDRMRAVSISIADLKGAYLGKADGLKVVLDDNAAGHGWFVDPTPHSDEEFESSGSAFSAIPGSPADGKADALTTILHELGHAAGLGDRYGINDSGSIMYGFLPLSGRRLPQAADATIGPGHVHLAGEEVHYLAAPIQIGLLPAGKTITIRYRVVIQPTGTAAVITNQGLVSGTNFTSFATDDPAVTGPGNPTETSVDVPPVLSSFSRNVTEDGIVTLTSANFSSAYTDGNGDTLSGLRITALPAHGILKLGNAAVSLNQVIPPSLPGTLTYTPEANYHGADSFGWNASDGTQYALSATSANLVVTEVNDLPTAGTDSLTAVAEDSAARPIPAADLLANDLPGPPDEVTQNLSVTSVNSSAGGTVSLSNGIITFTPSADFNGTASFNYTITDNGTTAGIADPKSASGSVSFAVTEVNDAPTAAADAFPPIGEDQALSVPGATLLANDSSGPLNENTQAIGVTSVSDALGGTVTLQAGTVLFSPTADYHGPAGFTYTITDNGTTNGSADPRSASGAVSFTINSLNDPPVATPDVVSRNPGQSVKITQSALMANDTDADGDTLTFVSVDPLSSNGATLTVSATQVFYTPSPGFNGTDTFNYTIQDGKGGTTTGTVTVTIAPAGAAGDGLNLVAMELLPDGSRRIRFAGIPNRIYRIQSSPDLTPGSWTDRLTTTADAQGKFELIETAPLPASQYFRTLQP